MTKSSFIRKIRDTWVEDLPDIMLLLNGMFPSKYLDVIWHSKEFKSLEFGYLGRSKLLATKILNESISSHTNEIDSNELTKIKDTWIDALQERAIKVVTKVYDQILFDEIFRTFILENQAKLDCTLYSTPNIAKIIPHLPIKKLYKEGRLKGAHFTYVYSWWFYSKEDAEKIAKEEAEHIAKLSLRAKIKAHSQMIDKNIDHIKGVISSCLWSSGLDYRFQNKYSAYFEKAIFDLKSVKQLVSALPIYESTDNLLKEAIDLLDSLFSEMLKNDKNFNLLVNLELEAREKSWGWPEED